RVAAAAGDGHRELTAGKETGALTAERNQAGPGQGVGESAVLQGVESAKELAATSAPDNIEPIAGQWQDRKSTRLNSSHVKISYAVFCLKKTNKRSEITK